MPIDIQKIINDYENDKAQIVQSYNNMLTIFDNTNQNQYTPQNPYNQQITQIPTPQNPQSIVDFLKQLNVTLQSKISFYDSFLSKINDIHSLELWYQTKHAIDFTEWEAGIYEGQNDGLNMVDNSLMPNLNNAGQQNIATIDQLNTFNDPSGNPLYMKEPHYLDYVQEETFEDISGLLGEGAGGARNWKTVKDNQIQYFPFYIRTINRIDGQTTQQFYYDNGYIYQTQPKTSSNSIVFLEATIDTLNETYHANWNPTDYFGRTEPIYTYRSSDRVIDFHFKQVAFKPQDIPKIRGKIQTLVRMLYPQLVNISESGVIGFRASPLVELRLGDLWVIQGFIESIQIDWKILEYKWEIFRGGAVPRGADINLQIRPLSYEVPNATTEFFSPSFYMDGFFPDDPIDAVADVLAGATKVGSTILNTISYEARNILTIGDAADLRF